MHTSLAGITVLDMTRFLPGPFATQLLAELGARVIKVEEPGAGDPARLLPPLLDGVGFVFHATNRGKESVGLDLKHPEGAEALRRLAACADVLVESFRPGVLERLGLGPAELLRANPRLVAVRLSGYGQQGPQRDAPGHDITYEAEAGILALTGTPEAPVIPAVPIADMAGGLYAVIAVLAALRQRDATGRGAVLDLALHDAALAVNAVNLARTDAARGRLELAGALPGYNLYRCADGAWLALGALEPKFWARFCEAVGHPEWVPRIQDAALREDVGSLFAKEPRDAWLARLHSAGVPCAPVLGPAEALASPQVQARLGGAVSPGAPLTGHATRAESPRLDGATDAVLAELGYTQAAIARLREAGVLQRSA